MKGNELILSSDPFQAPRLVKPGKVETGTCKVLDFSILRGNPDFAEFVNLIKGGDLKAKTRGWLPGNKIGRISWLLISLLRFFILFLSSF